MRILWDQPGTKYYETGIDRGVLYPTPSSGVAWNGLTAVEVKATGGQPKSYYLDGIKTLLVAAPEEYAAQLSAYTYPEAFAECDGTLRVHAGLFVRQQARKPFGLSYRTKVGNDTQTHHYKINIIYNALATPSSRSYTTLGASTDPVDFSWDITTKPGVMSGVKRTAHIEIDTRYASPQSIVDVEDILYGTDVLAPALPTLAQLITIFETYATLTITDNGDGTFTATGPDTVISMLDAGTFQITWDSAVPVDANTYTLSSL